MEQNRKNLNRMAIICFLLLLISTLTYHFIDYKHDMLKAGQEYCVERGYQTFTDYSYNHPLMKIECDNEILPRLGLRITHCGRPDKWDNCPILTGGDSYEILYIGPIH